METENCSLILEDFEKNMRPLLFQFPASLNHHQNWKGGLYQHTSIVARFADKLYDFLPNIVAEYNAQTMGFPAIKLNKVDFSRYEIFIAALFHDAGKIFEYVMLSNGSFEFRTKNENVFEPKIPDDIWAGGTDCGWISRPSHELLSLRLAKYFFKRNGISWNANIENAILCHMGGWSKTGVEPKPIAMMLHAADLLESQF